MAITPAVVVPADTAIGLLLPLLVVGDVTALVAHRGRWRRDLLVRLLPGAVVGVGAANVFLREVTPDVLRVVLVLVLVVLGAGFLLVR